MVLLCILTPGNTVHSGCLWCAQHSMERVDRCCHPVDIICICSSTLFFLFYRWIKRFTFAIDSDVKMHLHLNHKNNHLRQHWLQVGRFSLKFLLVCCRETFVLTLIHTDASHTNMCGIILYLFQHCTGKRHWIFSCVFLCVCLRRHWVNRREGSRFGNSGSGTAGVSSWETTWTGPECRAGTETAWAVSPTTPPAGWS